MNLGSFALEHDAHDVLADVVHVALTVASTTFAFGAVRAVCAFSR